MLSRRGSKSLRVRMTKRDRRIQRHISCARRDGFATEDPLIA
jgi:hypothetical protein